MGFAGSAAQAARLLTNCYRCAIGQRDDALKNLRLDAMLPPIDMNGLVESDIQIEIGDLEMQKFSLLCLVAVASLASSAAEAQFKATTSGGKAVRVYSGWNCQFGTVPNLSAQASNGRVEVRSTTQNRCNNPNQPVAEVWYTPNRGFKGTDEVSIFGNGPRAQSVVTVN